MRILSVGLLMILVPSLSAQNVGIIVPTPVEPSKALYAYLRKEAQKHFDARRQEIARLKTSEDIQKRQMYLREKFLGALGGFPEKTPLNARVVGTLKGEGFRVEKVIYESRPNHHVTANCYIPEGKGPFPGVLLPCGHSNNGKAEAAYQRAAILMARNGMVVLCYDPIGQGERLQLLNKGKPGIPGSTSEHTMVGIGALLVGQSTATYRIWDGMRSLDYLAGRPEVDPKKLGCTGNSGGGTLTSYLMALDERILAAAPSCYITTLEKLFATIGPQDAEQNITGQVAFGMEHADYITLRAPRPTLIDVATYDFFDIEGAWTTFREASLIYGKLGHGERVALFEFEDKHGFSKPRREAAMRWMRRWLLGIDDAPAEGTFPIFKDAELQCTRSGQVLEDFQGKSVFHFNAEKSQKLGQGRSKKKRTQEELRAEINQVLGLQKLLPMKIGLKDLTRVSPPSEDKGKIFFYSLFLETEPGIRLPGRLYVPLDNQKNILTLFFHGDGYEKDLGSKGRIAQLLKDGGEVLAVDLRGLGSLAPGKASAKSYFGSDFKEAFLALHLGRPLLGQRVQDILQILDMCRKEYNNLEIVAVGSAGPIALHAAVLDGRVKKLTLENNLVSWSNVVETPVSYNQLTNVVPGVLRYYDLPDLAAILAPGVLTVRDPVDAAGKPVQR